MKKITMMLVALLFVGIQAVFAQTTITGTVTDNSGAPVPGATVIPEGQPQFGSLTQADGTYSIDVPAGVENLVFSFIGMKTQRIAINGQTTIDVVMESEAILTDEVIVTGFGIKREKRSVTYQTEKVDGEELLAGQSTRASSALVGKVAGMQVNIQTNGVNPSTQILLRGMRSITANNEALIVIDGSIASTGAFNDLNPNDIESINVLKGATAAALYGSDAGNGAVIVTTKSGRVNQRFTIGFRNATTFETVAYMPDFQTEHGTGWDGEYNNIENTNWGPRFDGQMRQIGPTMPDDYVLETQMVPYAPVKDNLKNFYNTGLTLQNTVYLTGGDKSGSFYLSAGNQTVTGIVPDDTYNRNTLRVNANKKIGNVDLKVTSSYFSDETDVVGSDIGDQDRAFYWFILNTPANIPLTSYKDWDNPASYGYADNYNNAFYQNPYWAIGTNRDNDKKQRFNANVTASWDILENLNFTGRAASNTLWGVGKNWRARQTYDEDLQPYHSTVSSFVEDSEYQWKTYNFDALLTGDFKLTDDLQLKAILGANVKSYKYRESEIRANNLSIPGFYDISNGTGELEGTVDEQAERAIGVFADLNLGFKNWAFLSLTGRQDYTSTLPAESNGYFYPSVGLSVVLTEAVPALADNPVLSDAKVTVSNSTVYNDLNIYALNERYAQSGAFPFGTVNGFFKSTTAVDANIKKEKLNTTEFGANLAFMDNRFTLDAAYFLTNTTDLITYTTPSVASGANSYLTNIGNLTSSGFELAVGGTVLQLGDFRWDLNYNIFQSTLIVDELVGDVTEVQTVSYTAGYGVYAVKGEAYPQLKAVAYVRDDQDRIVIDPDTGNPLVGDLENMGVTTPEYIMGLSNTMSFKGISLSATLDYRTGHVYYAQGSDMMEFTGRSMESVSAGRKDFVWPNSSYKNAAGEYVENTNIQISGGVMAFWKDHYNQIKENYVKDATSFKIRELSLNYSLPKSILAKTKVVKKLTLGVVTRNLLTIMPFQTYRFSDPEFKNTDISSNAIGVGGYLTSPPTRTLGFSVNIEF